VPVCGCALAGSTGAGAGAEGSAVVVFGGNVVVAAGVVGGGGGVRVDSVDTVVAGATETVSVGAVSGDGSVTGIVSVTIGAVVVVVVVVVSTHDSAGGTGSPMPSSHDGGSRAATAAANHPPAPTIDSAATAGAVRLSVRPMRLESTGRERYDIPRDRDAGDGGGRRLAHSVAENAGDGSGTREDARLAPSALHRQRCACVGGSAAEGWWPPFRAVGVISQGALERGRRHLRDVDEDASSSSVKRPTASVPIASRPIVFPSRADRGMAITAFAAVGRWIRTGAASVAERTPRTLPPRRRQDSAALTPRPHTPLSLEEARHVRVRYTSSRRSARAPARRRAAASLDRRVRRGGKGCVGEEARELPDHLCLSPLGLNGLFDFRDGAPHHLVGRQRLEEEIGGGRRDALGVCRLGCVAECREHDGVMYLRELE
jgi:hypothetical protein